MANGKRIVVALGGNALQRQGEASAADQQEVASTTARFLVPLVKLGYELVIVHGNGPQVGNIVLHEEAINTDETPTLPLDSCVAMSQGMIGFWLQQALINEFKNQGMPNTAATIVSQMLVDQDDPAFSNPSKPIGPFYATEQEAHVASGQRNFVVKEDAGRGWRRVVPSPKPIRVIESSSVDALLSAGVTVITAGGGGVPVVMTDNGLVGVEAVIDKDFSAATVAAMVAADRLIILTAVDEVTINFRQPNEQALHEISINEIEKYIGEGQFAPGSMLPKVQAAISFVRSSGKSASIGSLERVREVISSSSGTIIVP